MTIPVEFIALFLSVALTLSGWVIKYMLSAVASMNAALKVMTEHLATMNGRMGKMDTLQVMPERNDDERYDQIEKTTDPLWIRVHSR